MSTLQNSVAGKTRTLGVNTWLVVLGIAVVIFGLNTGYATWKAARRRTLRSSTAPPTAS